MVKPYKEYTSISFHTPVMNRVSLEHLDLNLQASPVYIESVITVLN